MKKKFIILSTSNFWLAIFLQIIHCASENNLKISPTVIQINEIIQGASI